MSASPESAFSPRFSILYISFSPSSPYLPDKVSNLSNAGVSKGAKPWREKTDFTVENTLERNIDSLGRKSRVPEGGVRVGLVTPLPRFSALIIKLSLPKIHLFNSRANHEQLTHKNYYREPTNKQPQLSCTNTIIIGTYMPSLGGSSL